MAGIVQVIANVVILISLIVSWILIVLPQLLSMILLRSFVGLLAKIFRPDLDGVVSGVHNMMAFKKPTQANMNLVFFSVVDGHLTLDKVSHMFEEMLEKLFSIRDGRGELLYGRLQQFWVSFLGYPFWKRDLDFRVHNHVRPYDLGGTLALPSPCGEEDVQKIMGGLSRTPWKENLSPWIIYLHTEFMDTKLLDKEKAKEIPKILILIKCNHILGDGYSWLKVFQTVSGSPCTIPQFKVKTQFSAGERIFAALSAPWYMAESVREMLTSSKIPRQSPGAPKGNLCSWTQNIPVDVIKEVKNHFQVSFAAVVSSSILGAIQRAARVGGMKLPRALGSGFAMPSPSHPGGMALHAFFAPVQWTCGNDEPLERLQKMNKYLETYANSRVPGLLIAHQMALLGQFWPNWIKHAGAISYTGNFLSYVETTFPATTSQETFFAMDILDFFCVVPTASRLDLLVTSCGINNKLRISFMVDRSIFASEEIARSLARFAEDELQFLISAALP